MIRKEGNLWAVYTKALPRRTPQKTDVPGWKLLWRYDNEEAANRAQAAIDEAKKAQEAMQQAPVSTDPPSNSEG